MPLISSGISGTLASAQAAAAEFTKVPVNVVDTHSTTAGLALVVLAAARAVKQGRSQPEVTQVAREVAKKLHLLFAMDTLKYLHKGGRIEPLERQRTRKRAVARLLKLAEERAVSSEIHTAILHCDVLEEAQELGEQLKARCRCAELIAMDAGPVIGTHIGPGTIGIAFYTEKA